MISSGFPSGRNVVLASLLLSLIILFYEQTSDGHVRLPAYHSHALSKQQPLLGESESSITDELPMPQDYLPPPPKDNFCENTYGLGYLKKYRDSRRNYCEKSMSTSALTCFQKVNVKSQLEPFCVAEHVLFDPAEEKQKRPFQLNCEMRTFPEEEALPVERFPEHMAHTGPGVLLTDYFNITNQSNPVDAFTKSALKSCASRPKSNNYTILLKRDHAAPNHHWHSLWEIFSLYLSLDVLQITRRNGTNAPFFTADDIRNAQIVVLDGKGMGMMGDLWNLFAKKPIVHLKDFSKDGPVCLDNVLLPIPGSANIIWTGDWKLRNCRESKLVDAFVKRIMNNYGVSHPEDHEESNRPLKMTVVSRKSGHRRIKDRAELVAGIRTRWPDIVVDEVDFGDFPYSEQIRIAANSDILIGTHGGGLTLQLFMAPGSSVVEIKPHDFIYWGFRNMAKIRNAPYFTIHSEHDPSNTKGWQRVEEIILDPQKFYAAVDAAVHAVQQRGFLNADVA